MMALGKVQADVVDLLRRCPAGLTAVQIAHALGRYYCGRDFVIEPAVRSALKSLEKRRIIYQVCDLGLGRVYRKGSSSLSNHWEDE